MWESLYKFFEVLWGYPMIILLVGGGVYFGICTYFFQLRYLARIISRIFREILSNDLDSTSNGNLPSYQTLSVVLAGTIGSGNIAGVATAIAIGGPGAIFWMWVTALFGMMTKLGEIVLSIKYRKKTQDGEYYGGPMYYMKDGLGWKYIPYVYSVALLLLVLTDAAFVQVNTAASALYDAFDVPLLISGIAISLVSLCIIAGGIKRIGIVCGLLVFPMCIFYMVACLIIIVLHIDTLGNVIASIFYRAFTPTPMIGGFAGSTLSNTIIKGGFRGIFSNEAGEGTAATVYATAKTDNPVRQGLYGIVEVFIDTIIICTLTGFSILCIDGAWSSGQTGVFLTLLAFRNTFGKIGAQILGICVFMFAYSSYLGFFIEFQTSLRFIFNEQIVKWIRWSFFFPPIISCVLPVSLIWDLTDIIVGFTFVPNMIAIIFLSPQIFNLLKDYSLS